MTQGQGGQPCPSCFRVIPPTYLEGGEVYIGVTSCPSCNPPAQRYPVPPPRIVLAPKAMEHDNRELRRIIAFNLGKSLYTDDGELQDNSRLPFIDFYRDTAEEINRKLKERGDG